VETGFFVSGRTMENEMYNQGKYETKGMKMYLVIEIIYNKSVLYYTIPYSLIHAVVCIL